MALLIGRPLCETKDEKLRHRQLFLRYQDVQGHQDWRMESQRHSMARFEIYGDCRMKFLPDQVALVNYTEARMPVTPSLGAGIRGLVSLAYARAQSCPQDTVCLGVVDFLITDQQTGMSSLRFTMVEEMTTHIIGLLNEGEVNSPGLSRQPYGLCPHLWIRHSKVPYDGR